MLNFNFSIKNPTYIEEDLYYKECVKDYIRLREMSANRRLRTNRYTMQEMRDILRYLILEEGIDYRDVPNTVTLDWLKERNLLAIYQNHFPNKVMLFEYVFPDMYYPWDYRGGDINRRSWEIVLIIKWVQKLLDEILEWDNLTIQKYFNESILKMYGMKSLLKSDLYKNIPQLLNMVYRDGMQERERRLKIQGKVLSEVEYDIVRLYTKKKIDAVNPTPILCKVLLKHLMIQTKVDYKDLPTVLENDDILHMFNLTIFKNMLHSGIAIARYAFPEKYPEVLDKPKRDIDDIITLLRAIFINHLEVDKSNFKYVYNSHILDYYGLSSNDKKLLSSFSKDELMKLIY